MLDYFHHDDSYVFLLDEPVSEPQDTTPRPPVGLGTQTICLMIIGIMTTVCLLLLGSF